MKVIAIKPEFAPMEVVEMARDMLRGVESGEFIGFAAVAIKSNKEGIATFVSGPNASLFTTIGAVASLQNDLLAMVKDK